MPTPIGFVKNISITCCVPPGRSRGMRPLSHKKKITATSKTRNSIAMIIRDGILRIRRLDVQQREQRRRRLAQQPVDQLW